MRRFHLKCIFGKRYFPLLIAVLFILSVITVELLAPEVRLGFQLSWYRIGVHRTSQSELGVFVRGSDEDVVAAAGILDRYLAVTNCPQRRVWILDPVGDKGFERIAELKDITRLTVQSSSVSNASLSSLVGCTELRELTINCPNVDCDGVKHLAVLSSLRLLDLGETKVSDKCLPILAGLPQLRALGLSKTLVSKEGSPRSRKTVQTFKSAIQSLIGSNVPGPFQSVSD